LNLGADDYLTKPFHIAEIIRAHGGELALQESQADWTCFVATLPLTAGQA